MVLLGISVALSIQIVGALLVLALLITPGRRRHARHVLARGWWSLLSVVFAMTATVGGILLALGGRHPDQPLCDHAVVPDLRGLPDDRWRPASGAQRGWADGVQRRHAAEFPRFAAAAGGSLRPPVISWVRVKGGISAAGYWPG